MEEKKRAINWYPGHMTKARRMMEEDPENEDDFVLEEINLDEVEPEDMTGDIVEDITKVISVGDLTPEKIREEMEESE